MSLRRIGSRVVVVGLGVFASVALMAAPSWAAKGGNSANAKLCKPESAALVAQDASHFKNAGACISYAAKGGQLAKLAVHIQFESKCLGVLPIACLLFTASGFGLERESEVVINEQDSGGSSTEVVFATALGTVGAESGRIGLTCPRSGVSATAEGTLASGAPITAHATEPSSC